MVMVGPPKMVDAYCDVLKVSLVQKNDYIPNSVCFLTSSTHRPSCLFAMNSGIWQAFALQTLSCFKSFYPYNLFPHKELDQYHV